MLPQGVLTCRMNLESGVMLPEVPHCHWWVFLPMQEVSPAILGLSREVAPSGVTSAARCFHMLRGVTGIVLVFSLSSPCPPPSGALRSSNFPFSLYQILPMSAPSLINVKSQSVQQGLYSSTAPSALIHPIVPKN